MGRRKVPKMTPRQLKAQDRKIKLLARIKNVETLKDFEFGRMHGQSYRASMIKIGGEPYSGFIKCFGGNYTRARLFMPLSAWNSFVTDVLPQFAYPPVLQRQLGVNEEEANRYFPMSLCKYICPYVYGITCVSKYSNTRAVLPFTRANSLILYKGLKRSIN